ncbi:MAG: sigma-70 family RNA polymerase sigma factor [Planctomycetes bacterium]|nr:sigma-70 family RNA polymerase sigma factor [Planctomycetota bacterium]
MFREKKLLQAALTGDRQAFEKIVEKYQGMICAMTLCGTGRLDVSEDLAQETFLNAWKNLPQLRDLRKFRSWLCSIARNALQNYYRQKKPASLEDTDIETSVDEDLQDPSEILIQQETHLLLEQAIMRLPEKYRGPLVMYYRQDQSIRQSSRALDLSAATVKTRLHRARLMLKEDLACRLETALKETVPRKTFTKAVMMTLSAVPLGLSTTTEAATIVAGSSKVLFTGIGLKIAALAAVVTLGALTYSQWSNRDTSSSGWQSGQVIKTVAERTPGSSNAESHSNLVRMDTAASDLQAVAVPPVQDANLSTVTTQVPLPLAPEQAVDENYTFTPRGVLCGLVTDIRTDAPVSGARIYIPALPRIYEALTDEHGFYSIDSVYHNGNYTTKIISKDYLGFGHGESYKAFRIRKDECTVKHFSLTRGYRVEVSVTDEQGEAVGDVRLTVSWMGPDHKRRDLGKDQTKSNGRATLGAIKASEIPYQLIALHPDYASSATTIVLDDPNKVEHLALVMKKGISIDGYVEYADGVPAEDVTVHAVPSGWLSREPLQESPVDANGGFSLHQIVAGHYSIHVSIPTGGPLGASYGHTIMERMLPLPEGELLTLRLEENSPLFEADEGKQTNRSSRRRARDAIPTELVSEELPLIQGDVVSIGDQKPVQELRIRLRKVRSHEGAYATPKDEWKSCKNGYFEVKTVGHGVYQVQVEAAGYAGTLSTEIDTHDENFASIQLGRGGTIRGRVVGGDGSPFAKASVIPLSAAGGNYPGSFDRFVCERGAVKTQEDGSFVMTHMPIGMETLKVIHSDHASRIVHDVVVREGEVTEDVRVQLPEGGRIEGFVYDDEGRPEANVILNFKDSRTGRASSDPAGHFGMTVTDANGYYAINALPVDEVCYVERYQSMRATPKQAVIPIEGHATQLDFGGREIRVEGSIVVNGIPFANTQVVLSVPGHTAFRSLSHMTMANAQGRFVFRECYRDGMS